MNIILFYPTEVELPLPQNDPRARHILDVLRRQPGDLFDAGLINGPRGKGTLVAIDEGSLRLSFIWGELPPLPAPIHLLIGLPRPQTARDILRDVTTLGVTALYFVRTDKGEAGYAGSKLWKSHEWRDCLITGAAQAFCTRLPEVTHGQTLAETLGTLPAGATRLLLDNYEAATALSRQPVAPNQPVVLAVGSERGWSAAERALFKDAGFTLVHLGPRVLRTETACIAAVTLLQAKPGSP